MENKELRNSQDLQIQGLIDSYLRSQVSSSDDYAPRERHPDEDSLAAFTEGSLTEREAQPIVAHLVACSYCRHVTTELIKLDLAFPEEEIQIAAVENQPSKISDVLNGLLSSIFGANDGAVFAHHEKEEIEKQEGAEDKKK
jgi:hypothetical protein